MSFTPSWIEELAARGRSVFTLTDAATAAGRSAQATYQALSRAREHGVVYSPARGLWVIVPLEYRADGVPPWRLFLDPMLRGGGRAYYLGLLSAAAEHGASGQLVQEAQVVVDRPRRAITAGRQRIVFITRNEAARAPVRDVIVPTGRIPVSTAAMTALDLVAYPRHAGGWGNVASVIRDLGDAITVSGMREALGVEPSTTDVQRLGYILERIGLPAPARPLATWLKGRSTTFVSLAPRAPRQGDRDPRWRIIANIAVEPD